MPYDIFISYRHSDAAEKACLIAASLSANKYKVFYDNDEIPDGKFDFRIYNAIYEAPVFLIILTDGYLKRCCEDSNWIRWEVEYAFRSGRKIVPIYFGDKSPVLPETITQEIRIAIGSEHFSAIGIPGTQFYQTSIKTLIKNRISAVIENNHSVLLGTGAEIHIVTDADCQVQRFYHELIVARKEQDNIIWLKKGKHQLQFVSLEDNSVIHSQEYKVEDISESDYIPVNLEQALRKKREERIFAGHEYVDLGFPSGTLWATCNVGASKSSDYGDHFAWGETSPKKDYDWSNLKYCNDSTGDSFSKYNENQAGTKDNKFVLELMDDAAHTNWGGKWRMPTREDWQELKERCDWKWTKEDGHCGYKVTGKNGKNIFLPAAGWRNGGSQNGVGVNGDHWSSSLPTDESYDAFNCVFDSDGVSPSWYGRYVGLSVRPVVSSLQ